MLRRSIILLLTLSLTACSLPRVTYLSPRPQDRINSIDFYATAPDDGKPLSQHLRLYSAQTKDRSYGSLKIGYADSDPIHINLRRETAYVAGTPWPEGGEHHIHRWPRLGTQIHDRPAAEVAFLDPISRRHAPTPRIVQCRLHHPARRGVSVDQPLAAGVGAYNPDMPGQPVNLEQGDIARADVLRVNFHQELFEHGLQMPPVWV